MLDRVRRFGRPLLDTVGPEPYAACQQVLHPAFPHGRHHYWRSHEVAELGAAAIDVVAENAGAVTSPLSTVPYINVVAAWQPEDPDPDRHVTWVRRYHEALAGHSCGVWWR